MIQNTQLNNTMNEENNLVHIRPGGAPFIGLGRIYKNYDINPFKNGHPYVCEDIDMINKYHDIFGELVCMLAENKVVYLAADWQKIYPATRDFFDRRTPPIYREDGEMNRFKQELKSGEWGKQFWADYMWYMETPNKTLLFRVPYMSRHYYRELAVLQEKVEMPLVERMCICGHEYNQIMGIRIFSHSKIEHLENDKETIRNYIHRDDFIVHIAINKRCAELHIQPNPKYINYKQMMEILVPLFEKRGLKFVDKTDPYIYKGFPPDYEEHNVYPPCAWYEFID